MSDLSKQAALLGMADFFRFFLKTLIGIALARLLTPQDLGSYRQLFLIYSTLSGVLLLGFPQSLQYFLPKSSTHLERIRLITRTMNVVSGLGLICAAILWFGRQPIALAFNNPDLARLLPIYSIYPIFIFITQIYSSIMLGLKESGRSASFLIYAILCDLVIVLGVAVWSRDLQMIVLAVVFSALLQWLYAIWNLRKLNNGWDFANFKGFRTQLDYTIPLGLSLLVGVLSVQLDKLMISGFFNPEQFAVFSLGAIELPLIGIIINSVNAILLPNISALDKNSMSDIFRASVRKNAILVFPLTVVFFIYAREFITFVYGNIYLESALYFRIYLLLLPLRVATYGIIFQARGKTRLVMYDAIIMLFLNAILNYLLIRIWGMKGAAWATVIVSWLILLVYLWQIKYPLELKLSALFPIPQLIRNAICALLPLAAVIPISALISSSFIRMIVGGSLYMLLYLGVCRLLRVILPIDVDFALSLLKFRKQS
ncbi:MAG: oligosaccharide flippase family protein [Candidatus Cloacimonetes bacterium]|nr:oligosaccharide flippase family protein [Candidatus Cloacimonadota bacterium]MDY0336940.1 oligosaccharide flippase family protein [Candidatus Cloacimonadaceae bacterium]MDD2683806.1 oligosaccharide flippase family protein [Candidatus Cloacimonadota bacterium]MDD3096328.1 oligosaccharide flippase family protein [Candidatus Cloacimonadota bacterium]MDD3577591.1 oligosaccharide flippase family protein [Candidatus Cloacimonadota bacterium]